MEQSRTMNEAAGDGRPDDLLRGQDIVCVGFADWDSEIWTNQHHLMSRLARENRVLFVESLGLRRPQLAGRDARRIARRLLRGLRGIRRADGLAVVSPLVLPLHRLPAVRALNRAILSLTVWLAVRRLGMRHPILWAYVPQAEWLLGVLGPSLVVYHCVDDIAAQPGVDADSFQPAERRFAARADLVLASAPSLARRLESLARTVVEAPNVADTTVFAAALRPGPDDPVLKALPRPRAVFVGTIASNKVDLELIGAVARLRPEWSFALVGPVGLGAPDTDVSSLTREPNVHLLGPRPHAGLVDVLRGADAGLIPYAVNPLTASVFPLKVYEYLAAGLAVVSTPLPALDDVDDVLVAPDAPGFAAALDRVAAEDDATRRAARSARAAGHSWESRLSEIARAVRRAQATG